MSKRYLEPVEVEQEDGRPRAFRWREATYAVLAVLGHWREDARLDARGGGLAVPQRDLWRVEARRGGPARGATTRGLTPGATARGLTRGATARGLTRGVYELVHEAGAWRLGRIWD